MKPRGHYLEEPFSPPLRDSTWLFVSVVEILSTVMVAGEPSPCSRTVGEDCPLAFLLLPADWSVTCLRFFDLHQFADIHSSSNVLSRIRSTVALEYAGIISYLDWLHRRLCVNVSFDSKWQRGLCRRASVIRYYVLRNPNTAKVDPIVQEGRANYGSMSSSEGFGLGKWKPQCAHHVPV